MLVLWLLSLLIVQSLAQKTYNITLPWGIYQSTYDNKNDVYRFINVRFGASPTGSLRFKAAQFPTEKSTDIKNGSDASCWQIANPSKSPCSPGGNAQITPPTGTDTQSEDCLFLDIYVPARVMKAAARGQAKTAVAVWIFGGAYLYGSKNYMMNDGFKTPFYDGTGIITNSDNDLIFVTGNYRVGAFGWLAGTTMESQGYPNAGLSDQRLLFEWVERFINQVGGDKSQVSAWGESAGASSIMHHLISRNGSQQMVPKFQKAALQSPAFQWLWDRDGSLEQTYINYTCLVCWAAVGKLPDCCPKDTLVEKPLYTVAQLSEIGDKNSSILVQANQALFQSTERCNGLFPVGPSVDGNIIQHLAALEFANGRYAPLQSIILSHVGLEPNSFINPPSAANDSEFNGLLRSIFQGSNLADVRTDIESFYPVSSFGNNQTNRLLAFLRDAVFLSNNRVMFDAYKSAGTPVYALEWDGLNATKWHSTAGDYSYHATDLIPLFYWTEWNVTGFIAKTYPKAKIPGDAMVWLLRNVFSYEFASPYQRRWAAHATTGDPYVHWWWTRWWKAEDGPNGVNYVMKVQPTVDAWDNDFTDELLSSKMGKFWVGIAKSIDGLKSSGIRDLWDDFVEPADRSIEAGDDLAETEEDEYAREDL